MPGTASYVDNTGTIDQVLKNTGGTGQCGKTQAAQGACCHRQLLTKRKVQQIRNEIYFAVNTLLKQAYGLSFPSPFSVKNLVFKHSSSEVDDPLIILCFGLFFYVLAYFSPNWLKLI